MNRFYVDKGIIRGKRAQVINEDVRHITKVLRLKAGDSVIICDGNNTDYEGIIERIGKNEVEVRLVKPMESRAEAGVRLILYQAVAKGAKKMELIIQKGTELGAVAFVPVITSRTVVKLEDREDIEKKLKRWQRIALGAAKQSGRGIIPVVHEPMGFDQALESISVHDLSILPYEGEGGAPLGAIPGRAGDYADIGVLIGPEGGFSSDEVKKAQSRGIRIVRMGPRIMRTETAGMVASAILMYRFGDLGGEG